MLLVACGGAEQPVEQPEQPVEEPEEPAEEPEEPAEEPEEPAEEPMEEPTETPVPRTTRVGGWLDTLALSVVDAASAVTQIEAGAIDIYGSNLSTPQDIEAIEAAGLERSAQFGIYYELTFNPVGPTFEATGKLNPFSNAMCREAMQFLVDRDFINQEIYGGNAIPKWTSLVSGFPEYGRYIDLIRPYEVKYSPDRDQAVALFDGCMTELGAEMVDGTWNYEGEPVEVIFLIRTDSDGTRRPMGDIISNWLEEVGFTVTRQYGTSSELSPIWVLGNMNDGLFHIYTGAWGSSAVSRDDTGDFQFFYAPSSGYGFSDLWQNYTMEEADQQVFDDLANKVFTTLEERRELFQEALDVQFKYNWRVWVADGRAASPWTPEINVSYDLSAGVDINTLYPYTLRFDDSEGGTIRMGEPDLFVDPANPIAGSNWTYDAVWQIPTSDWDAIPNPYTGLSMPQRLERVEMVVQEDLPVGQTLDWVELSTASEITVPGDAWVDWDPETETFITADEKFPDGLTALMKVVYYYPADLFDITWHDGSNLSVGDFVMPMIMGFATGTEGSPIFDESQAPALQANLETFKGYRILSTDPLVIERYTDTWYGDAEQGAVPFRAAFWPEYGYGNSGWAMVAVANKAEANGELAYSADKADAQEVEWMNWIGGPSLEILETKLDEAIAENTIPFEPTMGQYVTAEEAAARYANLKAFYEEYGHFWVGTGPYILKDVFQVEKAATLIHNPNYVDLADKWAMFSTPMVAEIAVDGAGRVTIGEEATFDVFLTFEGEPYPADQVSEVKYLLFNSANEIVEVGQAEFVADGQYMVTLSAETTAQLESGANKLEAVAIVLPVAIPSIGSFEFVSE
jgi:peptide/nickel transport system substrate-binding protein